MNKGLIVATILLTACISASCVIAATLKQNTYNSHIIIGEGRLPDINFGIYSPSGTEITEFTYGSLKPNSRTEFTYYLKQKTSVDSTVYVRWGYSILPVDYITMQMKWNNVSWPYTESKAWHATQQIPLTFIINVGDSGNTQWDFQQIFTVSSLP